MYDFHFRAIILWMLLRTQSNSMIKMNLATFYILNDMTNVILEACHNNFKAFVILSSFTMQKRQTSLQKREKKWWSINFDNYHFFRVFFLLLGSLFFFSFLLVHYLVCSLNFKFLTFYFCNFILLILFAWLFTFLPCPVRSMDSMENFPTITFSLLHTVCSVLFARRSDPCRS